MLFLLFLNFPIKANRKSIGSSKNRIFKIALRLRDRPRFMSQIVKILNVFNTLTLKEIFCKRKIFFKKLEYRFLGGSTKIENASFPYKTAISEANVKTNKMVTTKWTYYKERSFARNHFICFKTLFQFKNLLQRVGLLHQQPKCPYL